MSPHFRRVGSLLAILVLYASSAAAFAQFEAAAGVSATKDNEATAVASAAWLPHVRDLERGTLRADVGALYFAGRGDITGRDLDDDVVVVHAGLRYERTDNGLTLGAGIGAQAGETDALSGSPQFVTTVGWRWQAFALLLRHVSNASLDQPNHGETMLLGAWRF